MASIKEIRTHIKSVEQTLKITNAMYLISSSNLRKARRQLTDVEPCFKRIGTTMSDILHHSPHIEHRFFDARPGISPEQRQVGYIVVTSDKGLAGAYNHNVLKLAEQQLAQTPNASLFVVGQVGRSHFEEQGRAVDGEFLYTAQNPTIGRARDMAEMVISLYLSGRLDEVYVVFTNMINSFQLEPTVLKLLPLDMNEFPETEDRDQYHREVTYIPSITAVMDSLVPGYLEGILFGTMVESYCSEQNARMSAMKSSSDSAREMLQSLNLAYNRARQSAITQEITEIVGGAQASF